MDDSLADTQDYLEKRAEAELDLAQTATHPAAVKAHYLLAGYYLDRLYGTATMEPLPEGRWAMDRPSPSNDDPLDASAA